jgi:hypothetical protein
MFCDLRMFLRHDVDHSSAGCEFCPGSKGEELGVSKSLPACPRNRTPADCLVMSQRCHSRHWFARRSLTRVRALQECPASATALSRPFDGNASQPAIGWNGSVPAPPAAMREPAARREEPGTHETPARYEEPGTHETPAREETSAPHETPVPGLSGRRRRREDRPETPRVPTLPIA